MFKFYEESDITKTIEIQGKIIALISEDQCITAVIKVLNVQGTNDIEKGSLRLLKFNTYLRDVEDSVLPLYDVHFLDQLLDKYDFDCDYDSLIGKRFNFFYTGRLVDSYPDEYYQYCFTRVVPIDDIGQLSAQTDNPHFESHDEIKEETKNNKSGYKLSINKSTESNDLIEPPSSYKECWIPEEDSPLFDACSSLIDYIETKKNNADMKTVRINNVSSTTEEDSPKIISKYKNVWMLDSEFEMTDFGGLDE